MMNSLKKVSFPICIALFMSVLLTAAIAAGPPLKDSSCAMCHSDFKVILPKAHPDPANSIGKPCLTCHKPDPARTEANKFSTAIHGIHQGGKTTVECAMCHAL